MRITRLINVKPSTCSLSDYSFWFDISYLSLKYENYTKLFYKPVTPRSLKNTVADGGTGEGAWIQQPTLFAVLELDLHAGVSVL